VSTEREAFTPYLLTDPDPVASLNRLNALLSAHPCDLEPVRPTVDFDSLSAELTLVAGMDALISLPEPRSSLPEPGSSPVEPRFSAVEPRFSLPEPRSSRY